MDRRESLHFFLNPQKLHQDLTDKQSVSSSLAHTHARTNIQTYQAYWSARSSILHLSPCTLFMVAMVSSFAGAYVCLPVQSQVRARGWSKAGWRGEKMCHTRSRFIKKTKPSTLVSSTRRRLKDDDGQTSPLIK